MPEIYLTVNFPKIDGYQSSASIKMYFIKPVSIAIQLSDIMQLNTVYGNLTTNTT